jgi:predicted ester cyclase
LLAAWNEGDLEGLDAFFDAKMIRRGPPSGNSDANSLAELKQVITNFRAAFPDCKVTIDEIFFQDDRSFARWTLEGTNTGTGDLPPTGKAVKVSGASFGRYKNGKGTEELVYFDHMDMMLQLGLLEQPSADG